MRDLTAVTPLSSRLSRNMEQSSLRCTVGPCWLSILKKITATKATLNGVCVCVRSVVSDSLWSHERSGCQAPLAMEFSRQEYCSGLPFPSPGDFPHPRMEHCLCAFCTGRWILYHRANRIWLQMALPGQYTQLKTEDTVFWWAVRVSGDHTDDHMG